MSCKSTDKNDSEISSGDIAILAVDAYRHDIDLWGLGLSELGACYSKDEFYSKDFVPKINIVQMRVY